VSAARAGQIAAMNRTRADKSRMYFMKNLLGLH
jgi:hypothetical protein